MNPTASQVLLGDAAFYGTLAAVRDLGRVGARVTVMQSRGRTSHSGASRFCQAALPAPCMHADDFLPWLLRWGDATPGAFLYPTSDDMAWLMAMNRDELSKRFTLFQPPPQAIFALLDKSQLYAHARRLGVALPDTHAPTSMDAARALSHALDKQGEFPVIVKPRTQACMAVKQKGMVVHDATTMLRAIESMVRSASVQAEHMANAATDLQWPLVQAFHVDAQSNTYSLAGFIDRSGMARAVRASSKVFQLPVKVGVGVAFEGRPVLPDLVAQVEALAQATGYFGVFEVEFIHVTSSGEYLLMDFNPRFYGQMQFEISRGMHLPLMALAAARGELKQLEDLFQQSKVSAREHDPAAQRYCNSWLFNVLMRTQRLGGRLSTSELQQWQAWMDVPDLFDCVQDIDDPAPEGAQRRALWRHWLRHPRSSFRDMFK